MKIKKLEFKNILLSICSLSLFFQKSVFAGEIKYDPESESLIIMKNGTTLHANILEVNEKQLIIYNKDSIKITIDIEKIKEIKFINNENKWFDNPNDTSLFNIPTARIKKAGAGYFKFETNLYLLIDTNYSITDNFSIGVMAGALGFSLVGAVYPKLGFEIVKDLNIASGIGYGTGTGYGSNLSSLLAYEVITYGNSNNNITTGLLHIDKSTMVFGGGMYRVSKNASIIMEAQVTPTFSRYDYFSSLGMRFFGKSFSFDFAASFMGSYETNSINNVQPGIITGIVYNF